MSQDNTRTFVVGILLAFLVVLVIDLVFFPGDLGMAMVPMGAFALVLWLNGYRVSKKK